MQRSRVNILFALFIIFIPINACVEDSEADNDDEGAADAGASYNNGESNQSSSSDKTLGRYGEETEAPMTNGSTGTLDAGAMNAARGGSGGGAMTAGLGGAGGWTATEGAAPMDDADEALIEPPPDTNSGDKYEEVGTNPFVLTAYDPFSTFAADVDSASYDLFRRDVTDGFLPRPASVRLEEYVNYFTYDYPAPSQEDEHPFSISLAAAPSLFNSQTRLLRVGIQAVKPPPSEKKPANVVFLIDVSGSMSSSDKLPLVQSLLTQTLEVLGPDDTVAIVTYASGTGVRLTPTPVSEKTAIAAAINGLSAGGSTAGASGIALAYEQAEQGFIEGGINHVVLCTDGDFNVGPSSDQALVDLIEQKRQTGITLTVVGFGSGNLNDSMMEKVTNAGNGIYAVISSQEQAERYAAERMLNTMIQIAKDMKIQVEFNPETVYAYRLLGYENRAIADEDFRNDVIDAGEVGAGHRVTALYELVMVGDEIPDIEGAPEPQDGEPVEGEREISAENMVLVKVRYKEVDATQEDPAFEVSSSLQPEQIADDYSNADMDFQWAIAIASFAEILKHSPYADRGRLDEIEEIVTEQTLRDVDREEFVELFAIAKPLIIAETDSL
ncbi:MAG: VWA domain-containing protein [Deltaproteobacteria bacterium]|nr:VWA domain-containing protein [Deltaproteobacteria bacterium]